MNKKGFTLVELLVVIAIIGILSSVAVVNLNSARDKAKMSAVKTQLNSIIPLVQLCYSLGEELLYNGSDNCDGNPEHKPEDGTEICASAVDRWPELVEGYEYFVCASDKDDFDFAIMAESPDDSGLKDIICTQNSLGCIETQL